MDDLTQPEEPKLRDAETKQSDGTMPIEEIPPQIEQETLQSPTPESSLG